MKTPFKNHHQAMPLNIIGLMGLSRKYDGFLVIVYLNIKVTNLDVTKWLRNESMKKSMLAGLSCILLGTGCASAPPQLGVNNGQLTPCPDKPNCVNSYTSDKEQYVAPIQLRGTTLTIRNNILTVLKEMPNSTITATETNYIRAEFTSNIFRFVDDVEFYFPDSKTTETTVHFRSASRIGYSDFGVNRERIQKVRDQFVILGE